MKIDPRDLHEVPAAVQSPAALRAFLGFEELVRRHPTHELFIVWYRCLTAGIEMALVMRFPKARMSQWPFFLDQEERVYTINQRESGLIA